MTRVPKRILGINPGTRYLGYAVLYGEELMDWGIKVLAGKWKEEKIKKSIRIVADLIDRYGINVLAIKKLHPARRTENLMRLTNKIKFFVKRKGLRIFQYSIKDVEKLLIGYGKMNKYNLAVSLIGRYPMLQNEIKKEVSPNDIYFSRAFEAVALGEAILDDCCIDNNK